MQDKFPEKSAKRRPFSLRNVTKSALFKGPPAHPLCAGQITFPLSPLRRLPEFKRQQQAQHKNTVFKVDGRIG